MATVAGHACLGPPTYRHTQFHEVREQRLLPPAPKDHALQRHAWVLSDTGEGPPSLPLPAPSNSKVCPGLREGHPTQTQQRAGPPSSGASGPSPRLGGLPGHWPQGTGPGPAKTALCPFLAFLITEHPGPQQSAINAVNAKSARREGRGKEASFPLKSTPLRALLAPAPTPAPKGGERGWEEERPPSSP